MLSGGARCRQIARHLATSRVTFLVLRAPAARSPARIQSSRASGPEAVTLRPSSPAARRGTRGSRPTHRALRAWPWGSAAFLVGAAFRADGLARSPDSAALSWVQGLWRGPLRAGNQTAWAWCWGRGGGTSVRVVDPNGRAVPRGLRLATALPPPLQSPEWAEGIGRGFSMKGAPGALQGRAGAKAEGDSGSVAVCFAARPDLRVSCRSRSHPPESWPSGRSGRRRCFISTVRHS